MSESKDTQQKNKSKNNWNVKPYLALGLVALMVILCSITYFFIILRYNGISKIWGKAQVIFQPIIFGMIFAYLINPIEKIIEIFLNVHIRYQFKTAEKKQKLMRSAAILVSMTLVLMIVGVLLKMVLPQLYISIEGLVRTLPYQVNQTIDWAQGYINSNSQLASILEKVIKNGTNSFEHWIRTAILPYSKELITQVTTGVYSLIKVLLNAIIGLIISIYLLAEKEKLLGLSKKTVYAVLKPRPANIVLDTVRKSHEIFIGFISGKILDSIIIGILCFIILSIVNMPYALLVSVIVGVTNVIPFFGPYIGAIPSFLIILLEDPMKSLYFLIIILILQQFDGNILGPKILGDSTGLSAFWVVFAILVGGGFFGVVGMLIGVPVFAVVYHIVGRIIRHFLKKKNLPPDTDVYTDVEKIDEENNCLIFRQEEETK